MSEVLERFLRYVKIDTQSEEDTDLSPSTAKQHELAKILYGIEIKSSADTYARLKKQVRNYDIYYDRNPDPIFDEIRNNFF